MATRVSYELLRSKDSGDRSLCNGPGLLRFNQPRFMAKRHNDRPKIPLGSSRLQPFLYLLFFEMFIYIILDKNFALKKEVFALNKRGVRVIIPSIRKKGQNLSD